MRWSVSSNAVSRLHGRRYYEKLGFARVGDFSFGRANGEIWPGTFFRMDL